MRQLSKRTLIETFDRCVENANHRVGVFCTTERINTEAYKRAVELLEEYSSDKEWRDDLELYVSQRAIKFGNGSTIQYYGHVENLPGLRLDEIIYHSLLTLERYGDTLKLLHIIEEQWKGAKK